MWKSHIKLGKCKAPPLIDAEIQTRNLSFRTRVNSKYFFYSKEKTIYTDKSINY